MRELLEERSRLENESAGIGEPPQVDVATAMAYWGKTEEVLAAGSYAERKQLIRIWIDKVELPPESLEVEITYKIPEAIGVYTGSGGALRCYLHRACCLAGETVSIV